MWRSVIIYNGEKLSVKDDWLIIDLGDGQNKRIPIADLYCVVIDNRELSITIPAMLQYSVYERITRNYDDCDKYISMIERNKPPHGDVRCLKVTEKQYEGTKLIIGSNEGNIDYSDSDLIEI